MDFLYPHNMEAVPRLGLWPYKHLFIISGLGVLSLFTIMFLRTFAVLLLTAMYAFFTITFDNGVSIYSYIKTLCNYFITQQSVFKRG